MNKNFKRAALLLLAILMTFTSACTAAFGEELDLETSQNAEEDSVLEQSRDESPAAFDDGRFYGLHVLGDPMEDDILIASAVSVTTLRTSPPTYDYTGDGSPLNDFLDANSFATRVALALYGESEAEPFMTGITEEELACSDFTILRSCDFIESARLEDYSFNVATWEGGSTDADTYAEAAEKDLPIHFMLETVPREGVIDGIMQEYAVDGAKAAAIYRQMLIDFLNEHGFYADSFFDWYSYDTTRAYGKVVEYCHTPMAFCSPKDFLYDDSVYAECSHLIFSVYAKASDIEALEAYLLSDEQSPFFKARGISSSFSMLFYVFLPERLKPDYLSTCADELQRAAISFYEFNTYRLELAVMPMLHYPCWSTPYDFPSEFDALYEQFGRLLDMENNKRLHPEIIDPQ